MIKNRWYVFQREYLLLTILLVFLSLSLFFSQKANNITRILLQDLRNEQPDKVNILVATHELESFAIKHARLISQRKKNLTVQQNLFGESVFVIFS